MARELARRTDRPVDELAAAVGTDAAELARAVHAEGALEGADARVGGVRRKTAVATLATGPQLEHEIS